MFFSLVSSIHTAPSGFTGRLNDACLQQVRVHVRHCYRSTRTYTPEDSVAIVIFNIKVYTMYVCTPLILTEQAGDIMMSLILGINLLLKEFVDEKAFVISGRSLQQ